MEDFDDDFGELYADVEVQPISATNGLPDFARLFVETEEDNDGSDTKDKSPKLQEEFVSDTKKFGSVCGESTYSGSGGSEPNSGKEVNDDYSGSDSEDDLNIVLNDEDCPVFPVGSVKSGGVATGVEYDEHGGDDFMVVTEGSNLGKNGKCGNPDGSEMVSFNGSGGGQNKNRAKGGYSAPFSYHKYMRTQGSTFLNNTKGYQSVGLASYCSPLTKVGWNGNACLQNQASIPSQLARVCAATNSMVVQCGYGSFVPWYWNIFAVNIDTIEEKPWRIPGADITDYFNFGFDENTWKQYCTSLEKVLEAAVQMSSKMNKDAIREQVVSESLLFNSSECEAPKGRAIQVEDSMYERQPSMDVRRPRSRDSDVVIQIKVLDSSDDCAGSGAGNVHEASEEGEFNACNNRIVLSSGGEYDDDVSEEHLEDEKKSEDSSVLERVHLSPGVDEDEHQDQMGKPSEGSEQASEGEIKSEEGVGIDTSCADPWLMEPELSLSDQEPSLTSYSDSDSEASKKSVHNDCDKNYSPIRRQAVKSVSDLRESAPSHHKILKSNSLNSKSVNIDYYSRSKGPIQQDWRHHRGRCKPCSKLNKHIGNDYDVSAVPMSGARDLSCSDHELVDSGREKEQLQDFDIEKSRDVSDYGDRELSFHCGREKVVDDLVHLAYTKYSYGEVPDCSWKNINQNTRKDWDEREYFLDERTSAADYEVNERYWYHADVGHSADDLSPPAYMESRHILSKHSSFPDKERHTQRTRMHGKPNFRDRNSNNDHWFDESKHEFMSKSSRMYTSFTKREMGCLDYKHEFPHFNKKMKRSARRGRHHYRPPLDLDSLGSGKLEDECQKYTNHQTINSQYHRTSYSNLPTTYVHDMRVDVKLRRSWGQHTKDNKDSDWYFGYNNDPAEDDDHIICPVEDCDLARRRHSSSSEVQHWIEDEVILRHQDELYAEEATFSHEEVSMHEGNHARYGALHGMMPIDDDTIFQQHQLNMLRRGSDNSINGSSKTMYRGKRGQAVLRRWNLVDAVNGKGKSRRRSSRARSLMCNGRVENLDQGISKKQKGVVGFSEYGHNKRKWLQNILHKGQEEGLDTEEGQIVTEEPCTKACVSRRDVSESAALTDSVKNRMFKIEYNSDRNKNTGGYDSQRILETIAKMEKRRERFKAPITTKKEAETSLKLDDGLVVDTCEIKQHRPARKRRWGGS